MSPIHIDLSLKEVLYSRSRKRTKWRLVSSPQQVASAQRGEITHRQPAIYTGQRSGCVWSRLNSVFWFLCQAPTAAQVLGASGKSRWPQEARREGGQPLWRCCVPTRGKALRRKAWFPQSSSASDSDCSSKPPTNSRGVRQAWGAQGRTAEQVPFSAATTAPASRGHPVPRGALVTLGGDQELPALWSSRSAGAPGQHAGFRPRTLEQTGAGAEPGGELDQSLGVLATRPGLGAGGPGVRAIPRGRCAFVSRHPLSSRRERRAGCSGAGRPAAAGVWRTLRRGKRTTRSRPRQTRKSGRSSLRLWHMRRCRIRGLQPTSSRITPDPSAPSCARHAERVGDSRVRCARGLGA